MAFDFLELPLKAKRAAFARMSEDGKIRPKGADGKRANPTASKPSTRDRARADRNRDGRAPRIGGITRPKNVNIPFEHDDARALAKRLGGKFDRQTKTWVMPSIDAARQVDRALDPHIKRAAEQHDKDIAERRRQFRQQMDKGAQPQQMTGQATPRQVDYIMSLMRQRRRSGEGGGFIGGMPTTRAGVAKLTKQQASTLITSLKGDY
ncbi:hypothetical protein [Glycomyces arizonensis]|uniref:hypothetical protein n=1 Tax=Glycomyces arizonensis TaxID=256035 RepID=UPI000428AF83|nr:hypothetical protein [Glycomyces arizonensis]